MMVQQCGYAGNILRVDLSSGNITTSPTEVYSSAFLGGRGIAAKICWDEVPPGTGPFDEENRLIFALGPLAGIPVLGGSRWGVFGKSPLPNPERYCHGNLGGKWGAELKSAGYDAVVVQGRSDRLLYLFIHDGHAELRDASGLRGKGAIETRETLKDELGKSVKVVAIGPAGENRVTTAIVLADNDASGSGGLGAVMGSKRLKAIAVTGNKKTVQVAQPERLRELTRYFRQLGRGAFAAWGMDFGASGAKASKFPCYGCLGNCVRTKYTAKNGQSGKFMCQSSLFYRYWAYKYYGEQNDVPFYVNKLCDDYGLDTWTLESMLVWLRRCFKSGLLTEKRTGLPMSKLGSLEFMETLVRMISHREGFGEVLALGLDRAANQLGPGAVSEIRHIDPYEPRLYITTALLYAVETREPIQQLHEVGMPLAQWTSWLKGVKGAYLHTDVLKEIARRFWGDELAADFSTHEGKALAAKMIQDRQTAKECLVVCDHLYPILEIKNSEDHVGDPSLESKLLSAVTGYEIDEPALRLTGERVFNLQRAIHLREGHKGREEDTIPDEWHTMPLKKGGLDPERLVPGRNGVAISRIGAIVDRQGFEQMKDEYYQIRGWDVGTGLQTRETLEGLGLNDVANDLEHRKLLA